MKNKELDVPYCDVNEERIKSANPRLDAEVLRKSMEWMNDRYQVHVNKDVLKLPKPWTTNPILQQVKFCNVRREHDRQSINLINHIVNSQHLGITHKLMNCVLFRMFNMWEPIEAIGGPYTIKEMADLDLDVVRERLVKFEEKGGKTFTNAFNTGGLKQSLAFPEEAALGHTESPNKRMVELWSVSGPLSFFEGEMLYKEAKKIVEDNPTGFEITGWEPHMGMRIIRFIKKFCQEKGDFFEYLLDQSTPVDAYSLMLDNIEGLGPFLAYQIWVDFTYIREYPFSENEFTIAGPGCKAGIDLLFTDKNGMTHEECIFWLRDNQDEVFGQFGYEREKFWSHEEPHDQCMNVMQLENMFCELQKYCRCVAAVGAGQKPRGKVGYDGISKDAIPAIIPAQSKGTSKNLLGLFKK